MVKYYWIIPGNNQPEWMLADEYWPYYSGPLEFADGEVVQVWDGLYAHAGDSRKRWCYIPHDKPLPTHEELENGAIVKRRNKFFCRSRRFGTL